MLIRARHNGAVGAKMRPLQLASLDPTVVSLSHLSKTFLDVGVRPVEPGHAHRFLPVLLAPGADRLHRAASQTPGRQRPIRYKKSSLSAWIQTLRQISCTR